MMIGGGGGGQFIYLHFLTSSFLCLALFFSPFPYYYCCVWVISDTCEEISISRRHESKYQSNTTRTEQQTTCLVIQSKGDKLDRRF